MLIAFILFTLFIYYVCEIFKYKKIATIKDKSIKKGRLYNVPVCYVKLFFIVLSYILLITYRLFKGVLERSTGLKGFIIISGMYFVFIIISLLDIKRIRNGHNDKIRKENIG